MATTSLIEATAKKLARTFDIFTTSCFARNRHFLPSCRFTCIFFKANCYMMQDADTRWHVFKGIRIHKEWGFVVILAPGDGWGRKWALVKAEQSWASLRDKKKPRMMVLKSILIFVDVCQGDQCKLYNGASSKYTSIIFPPPCTQNTGGAQALYSITAYNTSRP